MSAIARSVYVSGWCGTSRHDRCIGAYAGVQCVCEHHTAPPEPEPEPRAKPVVCTQVNEYPGPGWMSHTTAPQKHCPTCTCGGAA